MAREQQRAFKTMHFVDGQVAVGGYLAAADPDVIRRGKFTRIVKMIADDPTYPGGYHRHAGVKYFVAAAEDTPTYDIRLDVVKAVKFIQDGVKNGERVLVHCHAGVSRSVTVVLAYLMISRDCNLSTALKVVTSARPIARPNPGFMAHLRATDQRLARLRAAGA
jgi:protein-tyrosine phosphatase